MSEFKVMEFDVNCSYQQIEDGERSPFWREVKRELETWFNQIEGLLDDPAEVSADRVLARLRGNKEAISHMLELPKVMKDYIIETEEDTKNDEKEN